MGLPRNPLQIVTTLARARLGTRTPLKVTHLLTYACNVECGFCTRIHVPAGAMDDSQVLSMMNAFADLGTRWWVFNGGEPTLVPALSSYLDRAVELGFHTTLVTNGTRLEARYDELQRLDLVICSLHGTEQEHDRVVGRQGSYQQALRGLRLMAEAGVEICLLSVINEQNRGLTEEMLALGESLGAGVAFQPIVATRLGGAHIDYQLMPSRTDMQETVDWLLEQKMQGRPVSCSSAYLEAVKDSWPDRPMAVKCRAGQLFCEVTPEGFVVPCCSEEEYTFGRCHGPTVGWERAFLALPDRSGCQSCWFKGPQEMNLLLGSSPSHAARAAANLAQGRMLWD